MGSTGACPYKTRQRHNSILQSLMSKPTRSPCTTFRECTCDMPAAMSVASCRICEWTGRGWGPDTSSNSPSSMAYLSELPSQNSACMHARRLSQCDGGCQCGGGCQLVMPHLCASACAASCVPWMMESLHLVARPDTPAT